MVCVLDEFAAVAVPFVSVAGLVVGVCFVARYDALCEAGRDLSIRWNGLGAF